MHGFHGFAALYRMQSRDRRATSRLQAKARRVRYRPRHRERGWRRGGTETTTRLRHPDLGWRRSGVEAQARHGTGSSTRTGLATRRRRGHDMASTPRPGLETWRCRGIRAPRHGFVTTIEQVWQRVGAHATVMRDLFLNYFSRSKCSTQKCGRSFARELAKYIASRPCRQDPKTAAPQTLSSTEPSPEATQEIS